MDQETNRNRRYKRSYFGPILLITVGVLFLGSNLGVIPGEGWAIIWKFWPILLIIAGLDDLIRRNGIAWPILLIGAGAFLLYNNFGPQAWISWTQLFQLWPILLIAAGIDVLFRDQSGWMAAAGVILAVLLIGGVFWLFSSGIEVLAEYASVREVYHADVEYADIDISLGLGELIIGETGSHRVLIEGNITPDKKVDNLDITGNTVDYQVENNRPDFFPHTARWELGVTDDLEMDLSVNNWVGELFLALENIELSSLDANQGVGRLVVRMPEASDSDLRIKQAVGSILVQIPDDVLISVDAQNGLSRVDFPSDFELEDGYYSSPGATNDNADLFIIVEQAIGLVTFDYAK